jgi:esterase/lipase superfamily enzyme
VRKRAGVIIVLVLCYAFGVVSALFLPVRAVHVDALLVRLLGGKVPRFLAERTFKETLWYVTDRKQGPSTGGNVSYLGEYAGEVSHGLTKVEVPEERELGSLVRASAIKEVEPISAAQFVKSLQQQSAKPVVIWIHGYKTSFNNNITDCAQIARDLDMDANFVSFDWTSTGSATDFTRDVSQVKRSAKHLANLLETISNEVKPSRIVVLAHSLGSDLICLALQKLYNDPNAKNLKLDHVVLLVPTIDREDFDQNFKSELQAMVKRLTVYVLSGDPALLVGKLLYNIDAIGLPENFSPHRKPETDPSEIQTFLYYEKQLPDKIDLVDVSYFAKKYIFTKHRIYQERPVLEDLFWLIQDDYPAAKRYLVKFVGNRTPIDYWMIPP